MIDATTYPQLNYFISAYCHQDYALEFGDICGAIAAYCASECPVTRQGLLNELTQLTGAKLDEAALQSLLFDELDCAYDYLSNWPDTEHFLLALTQALCAG